MLQPGRVIRIYSRTLIIWLWSVLMNILKVFNWRTKLGEIQSSGTETTSTDIEKIQYHENPYELQVRLFHFLLLEKTIEISIWLVRKFELSGSRDYYSDYCKYCVFRGKSLRTETFNKWRRGVRKLYSRSSINFYNYYRKN